MKIEHVDFFYLAMPDILDIADGSQDTLLVRIQADGLSGWGECETSPLVSLANWVTPMSHSICQSVRSSVMGQEIDHPDDIRHLGQLVDRRGLDIAQTAHTFSGIEIALWDLLGKRARLPVYRLLGFDHAYAKTPYASQLFGETPEATYEKARQSRDQGFRAVKFGWGNYGTGAPEADDEHLSAARRGLGNDGLLMVDAGTVWGSNVDQAKLRLPSLTEHRVFWLEEPFVGDALAAYQELAAASPDVKIAGGEGAFNFHMAKHLIDYGKIGFIQIDTGRIGGIGPAKAVADYALEHEVTFVNHTFTTHLALSASLAPFAGIEACHLCEFPVEASRLAVKLNNHELARHEDGMVRASEEPGLGVEPNLEAIQEYLVDVEIKVSGKTIYSTPKLP